MTESTIYSLYLRLPSRLMTQTMQDWYQHSLPFAATDKSGSIVRSGEASVKELAQQIAKAQTVILIMAASDVTLLRLAVPPLSPEKLKLALPALVEDHIIGDATACHIVIGAEIDGLRSIAVIDREWMRAVSLAFEKEGARDLRAYPAQLGLAYKENVVTAAVTEITDKTDVAMRTSLYEGLGISLNKESETSDNANEVCRTLYFLESKKNIELMVASDRMQTYSNAADQIINTVGKIHIIQNDWRSWITQINQIDFDLLAGLIHRPRCQIDYAAWRISFALVVCLLIVNLIALHADWWRMRHERQKIYASIESIHKKFFPLSPENTNNELDQLRKKLLSLRQKKGDNAPEDFLSMLENLSIAWKQIAMQENKSAALNKTKLPASATLQSIAKIQYRNSELTLIFRPGSAPDRNQAQAVFAENHLYLDVKNNVKEVGEDAVIWRLRVPS